MLCRAVVLFVSLCVALAAQSERLAGGPYVVNAGPDRATIVWVTEAPGSKPGALALQTQKITLSGLAPDNTYHYDVAGRDEGRGSFRTAPAGRASFRFVVYGDTRTRHDVHRTVVKAIAKSEPHFLLHTGDLVADGRRTEQWPEFFSISQDLFRKAVFYPAIGNHERNDRQYYEFFDQEKAYYAFSWGQSRFIVLNSDLGNVAATDDEKQAFWEQQKRWLEEELRASRSADFRFVTFHHPPFTAVKRRQGGNKHVLDLLPLFEKYKVSAVFNGHDHNYQRHLKDGVYYVTTGGGGAPLYEVDAPIPGLTQKAESIENFVVVEVDNGRRARAQARGLDGRLIDSFELRP